MSSSINKEIEDLKSRGKVSKLVIRQQSSEEVVHREKRRSQSNSSEILSPIPKPRKSLQFLPSKKTTDNSAVQLYKYENGRYFLDLKVIKDIFGQKCVANNLIAIYSISGKYRSGKSFLLNIFLKYLMFGNTMDWIDSSIDDPFKYQNTDQRVTTGIWMLSKPIMKKTADGRDVAVFLMDTQGWHDENTSTQDIALVFALSALMSSVTIFNAERRIGEDDLHYFQCFSSHAKLLDPRNNDEPFQKLLFLIRDWGFASEDGFDYGYYDDYTSIGGKNFKVERIDPRESVQSIDASSIREIIARTYDNISAYLMPYPGSAVQSKVFRSSAAEQIFIEHLKNLSALLFNADTIVPKVIGGQLIRGRDLIEFAEDWTNEFDYDSNQSSIYGVLKGIADKASGAQNKDETQYQMAYQTSLDYYDEKIKKYLNKCQTIEDFENVVPLLRKMMLQSEAIFFASKKLKNNTVREKFKKKLMGELQERERSYKCVIDHEIELKRNELIRLDKEKVLADMMESYQLDDDEDKYGVMEAEIKQMVQIEEQNKQLIRKTVFDFQQKRREKRKNWFQRWISGFTKGFQKKGKVKEANLIDFEIQP